MLHYAFSLQASGPKFLQLRDKTILITGASSGIGRACAERLAKEGSRLVLTARREDALKELSAAVGGADYFLADLMLPSQVGDLCGWISARHERIDGIIHSAGVGMYVPSYDSDPDKFRSLMELNFFAPVEITRRLLPKMPDGGAVVTVSSIAGKISLPWLNFYSASKYALNAFSDGLRMELAERRIQVLNVCPCYVDTAFQGNVLQGRVPRNLVGNRKFKVTAPECADAIIDGIINNKRTIVVPKIAWLLVLLARLFPATVHGRMAKYKPRLVD